MRRFARIGLLGVALSLHVIACGQDFDASDDETIALEETSTADQRTASWTPRVHCVDESGIYSCADVDGSQSWVWSSGGVWIEDNAFTRTATDCKLTVWTYLARGTSVWQTRKRTWPCRSALPGEGGDGVIGTDWGTGTTADRAQGKACVDLYFNGSSHSGWQRCVYSRTLRF